ncbi:unnamed protein product [Fraxinus pennsylvanica]|uniref:GDSL esterase/lipase n=1 Tax=Fraxinus pennsylvanica TaxID=56036 RepID=A0AAD2AK33_9LAMI|nr:unnamed protein product [Fraxinus pennsylvanica]
MGGQRFAKKYLSKCIYAFVMGSKDYLNNYFLPQYYSSSRRYTPEQFAEILMRQYSKKYHRFEHSMLWCSSEIGQCLPGTVTCKNRQEYMYWDGFHPTEDETLLFAKKAYKEVSPLFTNLINQY